MKPIALIGAGGYVGSRLIERSVLLGDIPLVPIVRSYRAEGRLARYGIRMAWGDAGNPASLVPSLIGCGMAVNLTMGDDNRIVSDVKSIYAACREAGVPLMVHMSSAEVFGRAEDRVLTEQAMPDGRHWMEYGRAKAAAETWLRSQSAGPVTVVILRPGLIWGPGSSWLVQPAQSILDGTAFLFHEGRGICNLIHIDNLVEHLLQLARSPTVESASYNIADAETLTWVDYYHAIAREMDVDPSTIQMLPDSAFRERAAQKIFQALSNLSLSKAIKRRMNAETKRRIKNLRKIFSSPPSDNQLIVPQPVISKQMWWIQGTRHKLPAAAFARRYPDIKLRSFADLMAGAGEWLRFAGVQLNVEPAWPIND